MKKVAFLLLLALSACSYDKKLVKWCARCPVKESVKDSLGEQVTWRQKYDSLVLVKNREGKAIQFEHNADIPKELDKAGGKIETVENGVKSTITGGTGKKTVFKCATDSLLALLELERQKSQQIRYITKERTVEVMVEKKSGGVFVFLMWSGGIFWFLIFAFTALRVLRGLPN